jgi:transcriptional regulator with XRE-family HTH domain
VTASPEAVRLARRLRELRESQRLTQAALARALSDETRVAVAAISSWESLTNPKLPSQERFRSYALLFAQEHDNEDTPHLASERDLTAAESERFHGLHQELIGLRDAVRGQVGSPIGGLYTWEFERGPITIICPEAPAAARSPLAYEGNPNYTRMYRYADLDSLIELWGHIRASNPELEVGHRLPAEVIPDDLSGHLVVLGGIGWNQVAQRLQRVLNHLPVQQVGVPGVENGEIFRLSRGDGHDYRPQWEDRVDAAQGVLDAGRIKAAQAEDAWLRGRPRDLVEDVALLVRLPNPFNHSRTITICNGVYSRGVLSAVRTLTDKAVRERNEAYIANRFPDGSFALLLRVPMVNGEAISPDLEIPENRLYEWSPTEETVG